MYKCLFESLLSVLLGTYLEVEFLDHMVILCLTLRKCQTVFHCGCTNLHPSHNAEGFQFLHLLANAFYFLCSDECEVVSHCRFDLLFIITNDIDHLFMCLLFICIPSLEKYLFKSFAHY